MAAGEAARLVYFAPEFTETSTIKRVREFLDAGFESVVLGFERGRYNREHRPEWPHHSLGRTRDARYLNRLLALFLALPVLVRIRSVLKNAEVFYARNLDQLLLSLIARVLFNRSAAVVYEILDIQPIFTGHGIASRTFRWIERQCLGFVDLLVVSSPSYHRNYYATVQDYRGRWLLLENKLHASDLVADNTVLSFRPSLGEPWIVGYFGLIRGSATLDLIERIAARLRGKVEFHFRGVLTTIDHKRFHRALVQNPNIVYGGEYANPGDLPKLYDSVDFAWALDLENVEANSRWLMPCRFYEAGAFETPCLAAADFEVGKRIDELEIGWTFREPFEEAIVAFFSRLSRNAYEQRRQKLRFLDRETFVMTSADQKLRDAINDLVNKRRVRSPGTRITERKILAGKNSSGASIATRRV